MKKEYVTVSDLTSELSLGTRVLLGCFLAALLGVFIPLFAINLTGTWLGSISAYGDHLMIAACCIVSALIGLKVRKLWLGFLIVWLPVLGIQLLGLAMSKPLDDWWSAWPAFTRSFGAVIIAYAFLAWFKKQVLDT